MWDVMMDLVKIFKHYNVMLVHRVVHNVWVIDAYIVIIINFYWMGSVI